MVQTEFELSTDITAADQTVEIEAGGELSSPNLARSTAKLT
jgi:hypothetical protein